MGNNENFDWKKYLEECLNSTDYCALATIDSEDGVWNNPVYFAFDGHFNLYFISLAATRHMQNLVKSEKVAVAIFSTAQKGDVKGVQMNAKARILDSKEEIDEAAKVYYGRKGSLEQNGEFKHNPEWIFVKIIPEDLYYFDSKLFKEKRKEVPDEIYK